MEMPPEKVHLKKVLLVAQAFQPVRINLGLPKILLF
jgi:hypothetical protein